MFFVSDKLLHSIATANGLLMCHFLIFTFPSSLFFTWSLNLLLLAVYTFVYLGEYLRDSSLPFLLISDIYVPVYTPRRPRAEVFCLFSEAQLKK